MQNKLLFSIIIPTLNEENYLPKLLKDLSKQLNKNFEIIVVDGYSEDKTKIAAKQFSGKFPIHFYGVLKRNLSYQRNYGASKALGKYLVFLDADARISPVFIKNLETEIVKSKHLIYLPKMIPGGGDYSDKILFKLANLLVEISQNTPKPLATGSAMVFNNDFFHLIGGYNDKSHDKKIFFPEDHEIIMRARKSGVKAKVAKRVQFRFSLRRMEKEGKLSVLRKYILMVVEMTLRGKTNSNSSYEMGGHMYKDIPVREKISLRSEAEKLQKLIKKTSTFFVDSLS